MDKWRPFNKSTGRKPLVQKRKFVFPYYPFPYSLFYYLLELFTVLTLGCQCGSCRKRKNHSFCEKIQAGHCFLGLSLLAFHLFYFHEDDMKKMQEKHTLLLLLLFYKHIFVCHGLRVLLLLMYLVSNHMSTFDSKTTFIHHSQNFCMFVCVDIFYPCVCFFFEKKENSLIFSSFYSSTSVERHQSIEYACYFHPVTTYHHH